MKIQVETLEPRTLFTVTADGMTLPQLAKTVRTEIRSLQSTRHAAAERARADIVHAIAVPMDIGCHRTVVSRVKTLEAEVADLRRNDGMAVDQAEADFAAVEKDPGDTAAATALRAALAAVQAGVADNSDIVTASGNLLSYQPTSPADQVQPAGGGGVGSEYCTGNTYQWTNASGGSYATGANYDRHTVPGPNDFLVFGTVGSGFTVTLPTQTATLNLCGTQIKKSMTLNLSGTNFQINNAFSIVLSGATLNVNGPGSLTVGGAVTHATNTTLNIVGNSSTVVNLLTDMGSSGSFPLSIIDNGAVVNIYVSQHLNSLSILNGGTVFMESEQATLPRGSLPVGQKFLAIGGALSVDSTSRLDLGYGNSMILDPSAGSPTAAQVGSLIESAYDNGKYDGPGIGSSAVATNHLLAVGYLLNDAGGSPLYTAFIGELVAPTSIIVQVTYAGDANLSGAVDGSDYSLIDAGYAADKASAGSVTGWSNGDFNYDGVVDGSDYAILDNAFNNQGPSQASPYTQG